MLTDEKFALKHPMVYQRPRFQILAGLLAPQWFLILTPLAQMLYQMVQRLFLSEIVWLHKKIVHSFLLVQEMSQQLMG